MKGARKTRKILQEWDAFCGPLIEGARAYDNDKSLQDFQITDRCQVTEQELDLYLRLVFEPNPDSSYLDIPDIFAETPPLLEKALALRIADATEILTKILETHDGPEIRSESDLITATRLSFRDLLLPSPPKPGDYTWETPVR